MIPLILNALKTAAKKPAFWAIIVIGSLAALLLATKWSRDDWRDRYHAKEGELADTVAAKSYWQTQALFAVAKFDSIRSLGNYQVDTLWRERASVKIVAGKPETTWVNCPELKGKIEFDTTRWIGDPENPFGIRVAGTFYWPDDHKAQNRLILDPLGWQKPIYRPATPRSQPRWAVGLGVCRFVGGTAGPGAHIRYNRASLTYDRADLFKTRKWAGAIRYDILRF